MSAVYFIGGPMGVGKTALCRELNRLLPRSVMLDGDWCWMMDPFTVNDATRQVVQDNITHCLGNFIACGEFQSVVFCWVMHRQDIIDRLRADLPLPPGWRAVWLSLTCSPEALTARIGADVAAGKRAPDVAERALAYLPLYDRLDTRKLDTTHLSPHQAAEAVMQM